MTILKKLLYAVVGIAVGVSIPAGLILAGKWVAIPAWWLLLPSGLAGLFLGLLLMYLPKRQDKVTVLGMMGDLIGALPADAKLFAFFVLFCLTMGSWLISTSKERGAVFTVLIVLIVAAALVAFLAYIIQRRTLNPDHFDLSFIDTQRYHDVVRLAMARLGQTTGSQIFEPVSGVLRRAEVEAALVERGVQIRGDHDFYHVCGVRQLSPAQRLFDDDRIAEALIRFARLHFGR